MLVKPLVRPICRAIAGRPTASLGAGFAPTSLFADGSIGVLYDNNDLTSFYLDAAGTTAATVNGLVGLQLDKSQGFELGSEKASVASIAAGWTPYGTNTVADEGGAVNITYVTGADGAFCTITGLTSGLFYKVLVTAKVNTGSVLFAVNGSGVPFVTVTATSYTDFSFHFQATGTSHVIYMAGSMGAGEIIWVKNISIKGLQGNHRYQATTGFKPVLRGTPTGAELFTAYGTPGAGWSVAGATGTATTASSALPTTTASVVGKFYRVTYTVTRSAGSVQLSFGGRTGVSRSAAGQYVEYFDNTTTTAVLTATGTSFTGTVRIDEVKDVSAGSVTAPYGLQYDGVDDFLQTASVNFSATDKMFVCAGVRKLSDAARAILVELGTVGSINGSFTLGAPNNAGLPNYAFGSQGTVAANAITSTPSFTAPITNVVTGVSNISGDSSIIRVNGSQVEINTGDQGTGNYSNLALYFGRRAGASLPFNGLDFGFVIVGKTLTASQIANTERYIAQRTGVTL